MIYWDVELHEIKELYLRGTEIICFGGGGSFFKLLQYLIQENITIKAVVDNDINKQKRMISWNDRKICPTISLMSLLEMDLNHAIIIVTVQRVEEIIGLLSEYEKFNYVPIAYYGYILDNIMKNNIINTTQTKLAIPQEESKIPRIIHYCWFGGKEIPGQYKMWMETWKYFCPSYELVRWDESNYDVHKIPYIDEAYKSGKYSFVSDYARLDVLYRYGGIYLDTDVEVLRPLDDLLCQKAFMGTEFPSNLVATGLGMGAVAKHKTIRMMMGEYEKRHFIQVNGKLDMTTCPVIQSKVLSSFGFKPNGKRQSVGNVEIYPNMTFSPFLPYSRRMIYNEISYLCHHYAASWVNDDVRSKTNSISSIYKLFSRKR